jgi:hypothetical protein
MWRISWRVNFKGRRRNDMKEIIETHQQKGVVSSDEYMLLEHADHFIHTDGYLGMSKADAIRAVCILNGCSPEEVEGIVDESPFQTIEAAEEESRRLIEEEIRERKEKEDTK